MVWSRCCGVRGSVFGSLLFLAYINNLSDNIFFIRKVFADDSALFARVHDVTNSQENLKREIQTITEWAYQ